MPTCYAFEAKSIQAYVLNSGKLKDMVGASEIVDQLTGDPLQSAIHAVGLTEGGIQFSRRAGGAFIAFLDSPDAARSLRDVWSLVVSQFAPGLDFVHAIEEAASEREAASRAMKRLQGSRFPRPDVPSASPMARYNPRTGLPAVKVQRGPEGNEWVDSESARKRKDQFRQGIQLGRKLSDTEVAWPVDMESQFPHRKGNSYVGIIHADGNGLGKMLRALQSKASDENYLELYASFSRKLESATIQAAKDATAKVLLPSVAAGSYMPARPLVLGGDDLTMIVRGDLAISFTRCFLEEFEESSKDLCRYLREQGVDWKQECLTACAGIAFVKSGQPFAMGYELAEEMCSLSKEKSQRQSSSISFHRVSTSFIPDADWVRDQEMTTRSGDTAFVGTMGSYRVGRAISDLPALVDLLDLKRLTEGTGRRSGSGLMRKLLGVMHEPPQAAEEMYKRWRALLSDNKTGDPNLLEQFDQCLGKLMGERVSKSLPARRIKSDAGIVYESPLGDLLALKAVGATGGEA